MSSKWATNYGEVQAVRTLADYPRYEGVCEDCHTAGLVADDLGGGGPLCRDCMTACLMYWERRAGSVSDIVFEPVATGEVPRRVYDAVMESYWQNLTKGW
jgi:hypothetical protein